MTVAVVCVGNELAGDDAIGIRVGRVLGRLPLPEGVVVIEHPSLGLELLDLLADHERIVIVDAMTTGREPGTCVRMTSHEAQRLAVEPSCVHGLGVAEVLQWADRLHPERTATVSIVAVEVAAIEAFGVGLSEPVRAALPDAVDAVLCVLGAGEVLRARGQAEARAEMRAVVSISDVLGNGRRAD